MKNKQAKILRNVNNYTWQDIVRLSMGNNISIERFIKRQYTDLSNGEIKQLINFIDEEIRKTI